MKAKDIVVDQAVNSQSENEKGDTAVVIFTDSGMFRVNQWNGDESAVEIGQVFHVTVTKVCLGSIATFTDNNGNTSAAMFGWWTRA